MMGVTRQQHTLNEQGYRERFKVAGPAHSDSLGQIRSFPYSRRVPTTVPSGEPAGTSTMLFIMGRTLQWPQVSKET